MAFTSAQLAGEINTDPNGLGYAPLKTAKNWQGIADVINNPANGAVSTVAFQSAATLQGAVVASEYLVLSQQQHALWQAIVIASGTQVDVNASGIKSQIGAIYTSSTAPTTRANMIALQTKQYTRGEILWGIGTNVAYYDVYYAVGP